MDTQNKIAPTSTAAEQSKSFNFSSMFPQDKKSLFSALGKLTYRDLNGNYETKTFYKYSKDQIAKFIENPQTNEKQLREAMQYIYNASSHVRRLIQYFVTLNDFSYIVSPYKTDIEKTDVKSTKKKYRQTLDLLEGANIASQFPDILTVCFREDTYFGTIREDSEGFTLQKLPSDFCQITSKSSGVFNISFDFSYFDSRQEQLNYYAPEFKKKYNKYKGAKSGKSCKWQELDVPYSFAIKCNQDVPEYSVPPFAGILREVFEIEDYKGLKLTKTELENYALLVMTLGVDKEGNWTMDFDKAKDFWSNLDGVLPEQIGSVLSPMPISKIDFDHSGSTDSDKIAEAEQNLWSAAGVSSMIFNSSITSSNALLTSIKSDQGMTFGVVKSIETMLNRYLRSKSFSKNFHITFLDVSRFNRKEASEMYFKGVQYGMPLISLYCAAIGLNQADMMSMNWFENDVLNIVSKFRPLQSSATLSGNEGAGRPQSDVEDLSDAGEASREQT